VSYQLFTAKYGNSQTDMNAPEMQGVVRDFALNCKTLL